MVLFKMKDIITTELADNVPDDSPTKVVVCKVGRFQDNPIQKNVAVALSGGDFEDEKYKDGRIDHTDLNEISMFSHLPVNEIGGGTYWWRRGTTNMQAFFIRQRFEEEEAHQHAYDFYGRLLKTIETITVGGMTDDYGEQAYGYVIPEATTLFESGGAKQYIFRGKVFWRFLSWRP